MPTTQVTEITSSVDAVAARTNSAGTGVSPDWKAEEKRIANLFQLGGIITPAAAFQVVAGGGGTMNIVVGSGPTKVDKAALLGTVAGQGAYLVRFDEAAKTIALDAAHASLARVDEVYLVVYDNAYDATSRALPRLVVRKGDNGGGNPGVDAAWKASLILSRINIPGGAANIGACTFADLRVSAEFIPTIIPAAVPAGASGLLLGADKTKLDAITSISSGSNNMSISGSGGAPSGISYGDRSLGWKKFQGMLFGRGLLGFDISGAGTGEVYITLGTTIPLGSVVWSGAGFGSGIVGVASVFNTSGGAFVGNYWLMPVDIASDGNYETVRLALTTTDVIASWSTWGSTDRQVMITLWPFF